MSLWQAVVYGLVQGITEFLPISSSAHLVAIPQLFGWQDPGLAFDVALHWGTLIAVVSFFWSDWVKLIRSGLTKPASAEGRLFWLILLATIPGAIAGKLFEEQAESSFRNLALNGAMLILLGLILFSADKWGRHRVSLAKIGFTGSLLIGISQAVAVIPGVSRSGATMSTGLFLGLSRESAARFSFLLSTPIILGAGLVKIKDLVQTPASSLPLILIGMLAAAVAGILSIKFLLQYLQKQGFGIFVLYRVAAGLFLIAVYALRNF